MDSPRYELALHEGENPQPQKVIPMVDIRGKWQEVAVDVLIAMACLLPGIGFFFGCWLLYKYGSSWSEEKSWTDRLGLAYLGFWVVFGPLWAAIDIHSQIQAFSTGHVGLKTTVGIWQINLLLNAIWIGSSLAWLILETQKNQVEQSVREHKKRNKKILEVNLRAKDLLDTLQGSFPQQFPKDTDIKAGSVQLGSLSGRVLWGSTAVILFLMSAVLINHFVMLFKLQCEDLTMGEAHRILEGFLTKGEAHWLLEHLPNLRPVEAHRFLEHLTNLTKGEAHRILEHLTNLTTGEAHRILEHLPNLTTVEELEHRILEHLTNLTNLDRDCEEELLMELQFGRLLPGVGTFEVPSFVNPRSLARWIAVGIQIWLTTQYWKKLMEGVLITTSVHMRMNYCELLLFTALTPSSKGLHSLWSTRNLATLKEIVEDSFNKRNSRRPEEDEWKQQLLQKIQDDQIEEKTIALDSEAGKRDYWYELDLRNQEDIEAWWLLRQYIQIDFMDELAGAECCGVIIMMLVSAFFFVAVMDWLQNHQISCALILVVLLTCALLFAMFELFQVCVDINTLWERDNQHTLLDASVASAQGDDHKVTRLLESLRSKVAHSDARQELFGVEVTANLRNAWLLSLATLFLSTMWEVGKRFMEEADLEKVEDDLRGMVVNFTSAANYQIAQVDLQELIKNLTSAAK